MGSHVSNKAGRRRRRVAVAGLVAAQVAAGAGWAATAHAAPSTARVSINSAGQQANGTSVDPAVSLDGTVSAFTSGATNLVGGSPIPSGQVYLRDKTSGLTDLVSKPSGGGIPNDRSLEPSISEDGRLIAFRSRASNLVPGDTNGVDDVFVHDRITGVTTRVSVSSSGAQGNAFSGAPAISGDGRYVAYHSSASNLVSGDTNGRSDIFVHDRAFRTTTRASVGPAGAQSNSHSSFPSISRDGSRIAFSSPATNLTAQSDTNGTDDVFVASRTRVLLRASQSSFGGQANLSSRNAAISGDGRSVVYDSGANNLVFGDTNSHRDIFHHDAITRLTTLVSRAADGGVANGQSLAPSVSHDGRRVAYSSAATNLVGSDANGAVSDVFVTNLDAAAGAQNTLVSVSTGGAAANGASAFPALSRNGLVTAYHSSATNLVAGDTNGTLDVFARTS